MAGSWPTPDAMCISCFIAIMNMSCNMGCKSIRATVLFILNILKFITIRQICPGRCGYRGTENYTQSFVGHSSSSFASQRYACVAHSEWDRSRARTSEAVSRPLFGRRIGIYLFIENRAGKSEPSVLW